MVPFISVREEIPTLTIFHHTKEFLVRYRMFLAPFSFVRDEFSKLHSFT